MIDLYPPAEQIELPKNLDVPKVLPPIARALAEINIRYEDVKDF